MGKFDVRRSSANNQFYYRFTASNGEPVQSGEGYTTKDNCLKGIASVKANCQDARFKRTQTTGTSPYGFNQEAANGEMRWSGKCGQNRVLSFERHERQSPTQKTSALRCRFPGRGPAPG